MLEGQRDVGVALEDLVVAGLSQYLSVGAHRSVEHGHRSLAAHRGYGLLHLELAGGRVVPADEGAGPLLLLGLLGHGDDRNVCLLSGLEPRGDSLLRYRLHDDALVALADGGLDLIELVGRVLLPVEHGHGDSCSGTLLLGGVGQRRREGVAHVAHDERDPDLAR